MREKQPEIIVVVVVVVIIIVLTSVFPCLHGLDGSPWSQFSRNYSIIWVLNVLNKKYYDIFSPLVHKIR